MIFIIDRKSAENNTLCSFELAAPFDAEGVLLPRRQILATACTWTYRSPNCSYAGIPKTNRNGGTLTATNDRGLYNPANTYAAGDYTYKLIGGVRQYWVKVGATNQAALVDDGVNWWLDVCLKKLEDCKTHFGSNAALPTSQFPGAAKIQ
jgi:phage-related protein